MRSTAQHDWPALKYAPSTRFSIVASSAASGRTYAGSLPPSSRFVAMNCVDAERLAADEPAEAVLWREHDVRERIGGDADHVHRALRKAAADLQGSVCDG